MKTITFLVYILCFIPVLQAESTNPYTIGRYHKIHSQILNEDRGYCVYLPHDYDQSDDSYPVLYLLDGHRHFHYATGMIDYLSRYPKIIPPMILVDIEQQHRSRDMTPTKSAQNPEDTGGADRFLSFLQKELIPHIDAQYRTKSTRIISGYSLSGLFVMYTLLNQSDLFDAYIMSSPSIWWDNHLLLNQTGPFLQKHQTLDKFVFFAVGEKERQVVQNYFEQFQQIVKQHKPARIRVVARRLEDESHNTICIPVFYLGIKTLFAHNQFNPGQE
jgi:uncharacterized protein